MGYHRETPGRDRAEGFGVDISLDAINDPHITLTARRGQPEHIGRAVDRVMLRLALTLEVRDACHHH